MDNNHLKLFATGYNSTEDHIKLEAIVTLLGKVQSRKLHRYLKVVSE